MLDHIAPTVFWPLFVLVVLAATCGALWAFTRYIDRTNPFRNIHARRRMASEWVKPTFLPESWK